MAEAMFPPPMLTNRPEKDVAGPGVGAFGVMSARIVVGGLWLVVSL